MITIRAFIIIIKITIVTIVIRITTATVRRIINFIDLFYFFLSFQKISYFFHLLIFFLSTLSGSVYVLSREQSNQIRRSR